MKDQSEQHIENGYPKMEWTLNVLCIVSMYFTGSGMLVTYVSSGAGSEAYIMAGLFALISGLLLRLFWKYAINYMLRQTTRRGRVSGVIVIIIWIPILISISSWWNVTGLVGYAAQKSYLQDQVSTYEEIVGNAYEKGLEIQSLIPDLKQERASYQRKRDSEIQSGIYTGEPGTGAVERMLGEVVAEIDNLVPIIESDISALQIAIANAQLSLSAMRTNLSQSGLPREFMADFASQVDVLRMEIANVNAGSSAQSIARIAATLPDKADVAYAFSADPNIAASQRTALENLRGEIMVSSDKLTRLSLETAELNQVRIPSLRRLSPSLAVVAYAKDYIPNWVSGIALDLGLLAPLLFLMLERINGEQSNSRFRNDDDPGAGERPSRGPQSASPNTRSADHILSELHKFTEPDRMRSDREIVNTIRHLISQNS